MMAKRRRCILTLYDRVLTGHDTAAALAVGFDPRRQRLAEGATGALSAT